MVRSDNPKFSECKYAETYALDDQDIYSNDRPGELIAWTIHSLNGSHDKKREIFDYSLQIIDKTVISNRRNGQICENFEYYTIQHTH